jgi:hypothetical protein
MVIDIFGLAHRHQVMIFHDHACDGAVPIKRHAPRKTQSFLADDVHDLAQLFDTRTRLS